MMSRIIPIIFILVAIGLFVGYVNPTYTQSIAAEKQQIASDDSALAAATTFSQKESALLAEKNAINSASLSRVEEYLPDGVDNIQLIIDLEALAARSGISLANFSIGAAPTAATGAASVAAPLQSTSLTDSLDVSVTATGTYPAFQAFLAAAEQSLRPFDVTQLNVKDSTTGVYTYDITFRIYWLH